MTDFPSFPRGHWLSVLDDIELQGEGSLGIDCYRLSLRVTRVLRQAVRSGERVAAQGIHGAFASVHREYTYAVTWLFGVHAGLRMAVQSGWFDCGWHELQFARKVADWCAYNAGERPPSRPLWSLRKAWSRWRRDFDAAETVYDLSDGSAYALLAVMDLADTENPIEAHVTLRQFAYEARQGVL
jgi:hypothetical protein